MSKEEIIKKLEAIKVCGDKKEIYNYEAGIILSLIKTQDKMIDEVLEKIFEYGGFDGEHHKKWVLDQIVRILTKENYTKWVERYEDGVDGKHTYEWDIGIAP